MKRRQEKTMSKKKNTKTPWTEARVYKMLTGLFLPPAFVLFPQVRNQTGYAKRDRTADAVGASVWPSRGLYLFGVEIKVSYSDFRREIERPKKSAAIQQYCKYWYIAAPEGVVPVGEVPETWGLIECKRSAKVVRKAPELDAQPPAVEFVTSVMRSVAACTVPTEQVQPQIEAARKEAKKRWSEIQSSDLAELRFQVNEFQKASGVKVDMPWRAGDIGKAVKCVLEYGGQNITGQMKNLRRTAEQIVKNIDRALQGEQE